MLTKNPTIVKRMSSANLQKAYLELADQINDLQSGKLLRCNCCGEFYRPTEFYVHHDYQVGFFPICKQCLL
jgi:hypothetical protein